MDALCRAANCKHNGVRKHDGDCMWIDHDENHWEVLVYRGVAYTYCYFAEADLRFRGGGLTPGELPRLSLSTGGK